MTTKRNAALALTVTLAACGGVQQAGLEESASAEQALEDCSPVELVAGGKHRGRELREEAEETFATPARLVVPGPEAVTADDEVERVTVAWWNGETRASCQYRLDDEREHRGHKERRRQAVRCSDGASPGDEVTATRVRLQVERRHGHGRRGTGARVNIARACGTTPPVNHCAGLDAASLDDGNPCTVDACDPATGPTHEALAAGTACGDGDVCNGEETCDASARCVAGPAPALDDQDPCTVDACDATTGVSHALAPAGSSCGATDLCNGSDVCDTQGFCVKTPVADVDDFNPCTVDACDPATGVSHEPAAAGTVCGDDDDGNACNGSNACDGAGSCTFVPPGLPPDDGNPCTFEFCDAVRGVVSFAMPAGSFCGEPDACTGSPVCDETATCVVIPPEFPQCG